MKLVIEIEGHEGGAPLPLVAAERFPFRAGRGYGCDLVLQDPYAAAAQFEIIREGEGFALRDLGGINPTLVNGRAVRGAETPLVSGDAVRAGATVLRVFAADHPVPEAVRVQKAGAAFVLLARPLNVWAFFVAAVAAVAAWSYATVWSDEPGVALSMAASGAGGLVLAWAAVWSAAGQVIRRRAHFGAHVAMMSLYLLLGTAALWLTTALDFLFGGLTAAAAGYALNGGFLALLVYGSLSLATLMKKRRRVQAAVLLAAGMVFGAVGVSFARQDRFSPDPPYSATLVPWLSALAPARDADAFIKKTAAPVFDAARWEKDEDGGS